MHISYLKRLIGELRVNKIKKEKGWDIDTITWYGLPDCDLIKVWHDGINFTHVQIVGTSVIMDVDYEAR